MIYLTEAERQVMSLLWEESPIPRALFHDRLASRTGWTLRAAERMTERVIAKGAASEEGLLTASVGPEGITDREPHSLFYRFFGVSAALLISSMRPRRENGRLMDRKDRRLTV